MKLRFRSIRPVLCAAAFLPVILGGGTEYVLCLGEEGGLAIETANNGRCVPASDSGKCDRRDPHEGLHDGSRNECGACTDLPLTVKGTFIRCADGPSKKVDEVNHSCLACIPKLGLQAHEESSGVISSTAPLPDLPVYSVLRSTIIRV